MATKHHAEVPQRSERFTSVLDELVRIKNSYAEKEMKYYHDQSRRSFYIFRITGILIILFSVSIPYLTTLGDFWKVQVLPIVAIALAGLTGFLSFFQWQVKWQTFTSTWLAIKYLISYWELELIRAKYEPDEEKAIALIQDATSKLIEKTRDLESSNTENYFRSIELPQSKQNEV